MRFLCARHVLSLVKMSCFFVLCRKTRKTGGGREGDRGEKNVIFFPKRGEFEGLPEEKKVHFSVILGICGGGLGVTGVYARFCESHFSVVVRQRRKELMFRLFENSSNSLVESDIFRQEKDEICHIPVEVSKKSDVA